MTGWMFRWLMLLACCAWMSAPGRVSASVLTKAAEVHELTQKESAAEVPVKLSGVITYVRGAGPGLVLQDDTGAVMLEWPVIREKELADASLKVGIMAEVEGRTMILPPTPRISVTHFRVMGESPLPEPVRMDVASLRKSELDGMFVECEGIIRAARIEDEVVPPRFVLELGPASGRLSVWISRWKEETCRDFVPGAKVRVKGVLMRWKTINWLPLVPFVVVNQPDWVTVVEPPPEFEDVAERELAEVLHAAMAGEVSEPFRVSGVVTYADSSAVIIHKKDDILWIRPAESVGLSPGDQVQAVGFPGLNGPRGELDDAIIRKTGKVTLPPAERMEPEYFQKKEYLWKDGIRVRMRGTVTRGSAEPEGAPLQMLSGRRRIPLYFSDVPAESRLPVEGSMVEVTGVLEAGLNERLLRIGRGEADYRLHVQSVQDLEVLQSGPWWTPVRIFSVVGSAALLAVTAGGWALFLRRRVDEKSRALVQEIAARREQEIVLHERKRLAADLHDTLEQTLTGASLQLDAMGEADPPKPLVIARRLLDRSRDELRRAVWDLTPEMIGESGFAEALETIAEEQSELGVEIDVAIQGQASRVPDRIAAHFCRVVQECISNAARHGKASHITVELGVSDREISLKVEDNGGGFDQEKAPGISSGHFGINGMKERLRRLGGELEIRSEEGRGTLVRACCPLDGGDRMEMTR